MASEFLRRQAATSRKRIDEQFGPNAYGGSNYNPTEEQKQQAHQEVLEWQARQKTNREAQMKEAASNQRRTVNIHALGAGGAPVELPSEKERQEMKEARKLKNEETKQQNSEAADDVRRASSLGLSLSEYYAAQEKDYAELTEMADRVSSQQKELLELQAEHEANPYDESVVDQYNSLFEIYKTESASLKTARDAYDQKYFGELEQEEPEEKEFIDRLAEATAKIGAGTSGDPRAADAEATFAYMPERSATEKNKVENVLGAGGKGYQANVAETLGFLMSEEANEQETAADVMFGVSGLTDVDYEPQFIKDQKAKISEKAYAYSDKMNSEAEEHTIMAKDGVGTFGSMVVDAGIAGTQMAMDMGIAALTHTSALVPMAVRSFGGGATEARQAGADWEQQFAYGVGSAAVEILTEKIGNVALPFGKMYGAGALDDLIKAGIEKTARSNAGRLALTMLVTGLSEGGEELISSLLNPLLKKMTYDPDALQEFGTSEFWGETLEEFIIGAMLGGIGGSVEIASDFVNSRAAGAKLRAQSADVIQAVIEAGLLRDPKTLSYQLAKDAQQKLDAGKTLSDREIGNMYYANVRAIAMEQAGEEPEDTGAPLDLLDTEEVQTKEAPAPSETAETGEEILTERYQDQIDLGEITPEQIRELGAEYDAGATMAEIDQRVHEIVTAEQKEDAPAIESETNEVSPVQGLYGSESTASSANAESVARGDADFDAEGTGIRVNENEIEQLRERNLEVYNERTLSDRGAKRDDGKSAEGQAGAVSDRAEAGINVGADGKYQQNRGTNRSSNLQKVSSRSLGIRNGTDQATLSQETKPSKAVKKAVRAAEQMGVHVQMVRGEIQVVEGGKVHSVTGVISGNGYAVIRVDHYRYTGEQLAVHEMGHPLFDESEALTEDARQILRDVYGEEKLTRMICEYMQLYKDVYLTAEELISGDLSAEREAELERMMVVEMANDALAGINRARTGNVSRDARAVQELRALFQRETNIDVNVIFDEAVELDGEDSAISVREDAATAAVGNKGPTRYSIDTEFASELDAWNGKSNKIFHVGTTSEALQSIGVEDRNIVWHGKKIAEILRKHSGMTLEIIQKVPEVLENPVIILQSKNSESRLAIFGEITDRNGAPITAILELQPTNKGGELLDMNVIVSAYGKDSNPSGFIKSSGLVYLDPDKKRTDNWLRAVGLQLPSVARVNYGSVGRVSYQDGKVKIDSVPYQQYMQGADKNAQESNGASPFKTGVTSEEGVTGGDAPLAPNLLQQDEKVKEENVQPKYSVDDKTQKLAETMSMRDLSLNATALEGRIRAFERVEREGMLTPDLMEDYEEAKQQKKIFDGELSRRKSDAQRARTAEGRTEARKAAQKAIHNREITPDETAMARRNLRKNVMEAFCISENRLEIRDLIDAKAEKYARQKKLTQKDVDELFDTLIRTGTVWQRADTMYEEIRNFMKDGHIYVNPSVVEEFGDDWDAFRKRAFGNQIYLTADESKAGIDQWAMELENVFRGAINEGGLDLKEQLEQIVDLAEQGKAEKMTLEQMADALGKEHGETAEQRLLDELEEKLTNALKQFAAQAKIEIELKRKSAYQQALEREKRMQTLERQRRDREMRALQQSTMKRLQRLKQRQAKEMRELQQKTMKQLQWLKKNRDRAPKDLRKEFDTILGDIDTIAISAANEMNWSDKYNANWRTLRDMYQWARENDENFLPSKELETIMERLDGSHIGDMDFEQLQDLYKAAVALRTEYYNRNNVINDELNRMFAEVCEESKEEIQNAKGPSGDFREKWFSEEQLNPILYIERLADWNKSSTWFSFGKQLEKGERDMRRYQAQAKKILNDFIDEHAEWLKKADGQGKDAIWYELEVPECVKLNMGDKPVFGESIKVYMTPAQKVHMYLESKNYDNLRHMLGGRTFADRTLYEKGKRQDAYAHGTTIHMAPETVKKIVSDLTEEEMALANVLERYYNEFAKTEINRVSNPLLGYDKAMSSNYAPIFTNQTYVNGDPALYDGTAVGIGHMKGRVKGSRNATYNISALDAFEKHVDQTSRFVGMAIPVKNFNTLLKHGGNNHNLLDVIEHKWGAAASGYLNDLLTDLQNPKVKKRGILEQWGGKALSNYVSAVFGANPGIVFKQFASFPAAAAVLGFENWPSPIQMKRADATLIAKYTSELDYRLLGYATPETAELKKNPGKLQTNKTMKFLFGGGSIIAMDGFTVKSLWPWAENYVRKNFPDLEIGTQEDIDNGSSPFYRKVKEVFEDAVSTTQPMYDVMHRSRIMQSDNTFARAFTMFKTVPMQEYNTLRRFIGEASYEKANGTKESKDAAAKQAGQAVVSVLASTIMLEAIEFLNALLKNKAKNYRDDDDELTVGSAAAEWGIKVAQDLAGMSIAGTEIAEAITSYLKSEKWTGIDMPGGEQFNEVLEKLQSVSQSMHEIVSGAFNIIKNEGDFGEYFGQKSSVILGNIRDLAMTVSTYFGGIPAQNVEKYLLGLIDWISPELGAAYDAIWSETTKSDLSGLEGTVLEQSIQRVLNSRGYELSAEAATEIARLYAMGKTDAVPSEAPKSFTGSETDENGDTAEYKVELDATGQQRYRYVWNESVAGAIEVMIKTEEYQSASDKEKTALLKRLYDYGAQLAKADASDKFQPESWVNKSKELINAGANPAQAIASVRKVSSIESSKDADGESEKDGALKQIQYIRECSLKQQQKERLVEQLLSKEALTNYTHYCENHGVSVLDYAEALAVKTYTKADKDENGKSISGSAMLKVLEYIDGMNLESEEKIYIALCFYKESNIRMYTNWYSTAILELD